MDTMSNREYAVMHDIIMEAFEVEPIDAQVTRFWHFMPAELKKEIAHWGIDDTPTKDNIYTWLLSVRENINEVGVK